MNQRTRIILRYLFVTLLGVFLHFAYELSGDNTIVGFFAPVNESVWEHLKLIFFPMLLLTFWDLFTRYRSTPNFLPARTAGILSGMIFIVVSFYTISGIIGTSIAWVDILLYFIGVAVAFWTGWRVRTKYRDLSSAAAIVVLIVFVILFVIFTIAPPDLGIFIPPAA